ncbi:RNA 2',3'-cyclic phosphodiesterase [Alkalicaulis satelles]|uniref:RNA 2',3'-cyclic phosphodiesterase n=1 Tax=Alkalicaulis satelles TaxID=2609175 RepID=A0A5M6ZJL1_9PROT|nr:RNA 2',3'-cyclic phosphodiesterase [Alkalicaulis satelles]KAA5802421.1 RNA 2',3'-cyclic phosphodiesterase [Alkalicaulis satelles]
MSLRVFAALPVDDSVAGRIAPLQKGVPGAAWRPQENFHVTLAFFGELEEPVISELDTELGRIRQAPFEWMFQGAGHFGKAEPDSLWLGVAANPALNGLAKACVQAARRAGVEPERRVYTPHLTLAYLRRGVDIQRVQRFEQRLNLYRSAPMRADRFHLYSSWRSKPGRPNTYQIEAEYPLTG